MAGSLLPQGTQALFPIKAERAYLNNASIAPMSLPVIAAVDAFTADVRDFGRNNYPSWCRRADTEDKERIGKLIGAYKSEIAFIKNTTEGLVTVANGLKWRAGDNVIIATGEASIAILFRHLSASPLVSIAQIEGRTRGAGSEFMLACDMSFAARESAILGHPEAGTGVSPGAGGIQHLARLMGRARALEVMFDRLRHCKPRDGLRM